MTALPSVSVAMATYNGAEFIVEQLESISSQTYQPFELVVCDDASVDRTCDLIEQFASRSELRVRLTRNESRLGSFRNFLQAARLSHGELIAFCDQDDVWRRDKLEICASEFAADPQVRMVIHSGAVFGTHTSGRPARFPSYHRRVVATPATLPLNEPIPGFAQVFHHDLRACLDPDEESVGQVFPGGLGPEHDGWVGFLAAAFGKVVLLPDDLVSYRQHGGNVAGAPTFSGAAEVVAISLAWAGNQDDLLRRARAARARAQVIEKLAPEVLGSSDSPDDGRVDAARARAAMWCRSAEVADRRSSVYAADVRRSERMRTLLFNALRGDYGSRQRGLLGLRSLARDLHHVARIRTLEGRSASSPRPPGSEDDDS
jgi:hypothetical protein